MRENKLLLWMKEGDPEKVPVMFGGYDELSASYFGIPKRDVTPQIVEKAMQEMGTWCFVDVGSPMLFDAIEFCTELTMKTREENQSDETKRTYTEIQTPIGKLRQVWEEPKGFPGTWIEHYVKSESDLVILKKFVELAADTIINKPVVRDSVCRRIKESIAKWSGSHPYVRGYSLAL